MLLKSLAQLISFIYSWKQIYDETQQSAVFEKTDDNGSLKYPKEALVFHAFKANHYEKIDYFTCQFVAECVTCHMIASNKPSFKKKYTLDRFKEISPNDKINEDLRDFLISFISILKLVFSGGTGMEKSCEECKNKFNTLLGEGEGEYAKAGRHFLKTLAGPPYALLQKVAGMIVQNAITSLPFIQKGDNVTILVPFTTNMLAIAISYPHKIRSLLQNTNIEKCHDSLRPIFKDLFDSVKENNLSVDLLQFVGSNFEGKLDKVKK